MRFARALEAALLVALTAGCSGGTGGGGGDKGGDPPVADAGDDGTARIYQTRTLNGSQSEDPEGKELSFAWTILGAPDASAATLTSGGAAAVVTFVPDAEGAYLFGLVVSDGKKTSAIDTVEITVSLRVAVFGDVSGSLASELALSGAGEVVDHYGYPESFVVGGSDAVVLLQDYRYRQPSLLAYYTFDGNQESLTGGSAIDAALIDGDWVVWTEVRAGQSDVFARSLSTGVEQRLTNSSQSETLGNLEEGFVTWQEVRDPAYAIDVFAYDLATGVEIQVSPLDLGIDEIDPRTDGSTVVYTANTSTPDAWAFDLGTQSPTAVATSTTATEIAMGVSGDFMVLVINTGIDPTLVRERISDGNRVAIAVAGGVHEVGGDYVLFSDLTGLNAYRFSTGAVVNVAAQWVDTDLADGVVAWTATNVATSSDDVYTKVLPAGAVTQVTATTGDEYGPAILGAGVAWSADDATGLSQGLFSADGGATVELASYGMIPLSDVVADYDVAIVSHEAAKLFRAATIDALSAGGVPMLSFNRDGESVGDYYVDEGLYNLAIDASQCGPATVTIDSAYLDGFALGTYWELERFLGGGATYEARSFDVYAGAGTPPADWTLLATHAADPGACVLGGEPAIATFTNADGTSVILDGVATDYLEFWEPSRRALTLSELRYLAATRAP